MAKLCSEQHVLLSTVHSFYCKSLMCISAGILQQISHFGLICIYSKWLTKWQNYVADSTFFFFVYKRFIGKISMVQYNEKV